ncbi:hypothetical protein ACJZ2D_017205 [Fusarium nematophilum]
MKQLTIKLKKKINQSALAKFEVRYAQLCLAREADKEKGPQKLRTSVDEIDALAKQLEMDKGELHRHLDEGRMWARICGTRVGILPFISLNARVEFKITKIQWSQLQKGLLDAFHSLLLDEYAEDIILAGKAFLEMMDGSGRIFCWEGKELDLSATDLASSLRETRDPAD